MSERQPLRGPDARRFRTGRMCLNFAHTGGDGPLAAFELLHDDSDVRRWLSSIADVEVVADDTTVEDAVALRRAIWNGANELARGAAPAEVDRRAINTAASRVPPSVRLTDTGHLETPAATTTQVLSLLARDAVMLFGGPLGQRIRVCAAEDCGLLFVDQSRPGTRRWCSMQRCGNLAKVRRFRAGGSA